MQKLLTENRDWDVRAYFIWGPYQRNDNVDIARVDGKRFSSPNASQFWTPTDRMARELSSELQLPGGRLAWDVYLVYGKGVVWNDTFPRPTYWQQQIGVPQGDPLNMRVLQSHIRQLLQQK